MKISGKQVFSTCSHNVRAWGLRSSKREYSVEGLDESSGQLPNRALFH